jgi:ribonuclease HI
VVVLQQWFRRYLASVFTRINLFTDSKYVIRVCEILRH